jgi:hypothetical protein
VVFKFQVDIPEFRRLPGLPLVNVSERPMISHRGSKVSSPGQSNIFNGSQSFGASSVDQYRRDSYADRTRDILKVLHDKTYGEKIAKTKAEVDALGDYNAFSKPRPSMVKQIWIVVVENTDY